MIIFVCLLLTLPAFIWMVKNTPTLFAWCVVIVLMLAGLKSLQK